MTCVNGSTELSWLAGSGVVVLNSCSATMYGLRVLLWFIGLLDYIGHPQPPQLNWARVYCGCQPGPTGVALHPGRMMEKPERQPYVHWTTCYDFEETWIIDVSSCTPPRPGRGYDLVDFGITSLSDLIHLFIHELLTHARRHVAWLCTAMSCPIQPELPWYCSMPQPHQHVPSSEYRNSEATNHSSDAKN